MKKMQTPEITFVEFDNADVITNSAMVSAGSNNTNGYGSLKDLGNQFYGPNPLQ